jgi:hypothetical protein
LQSGETKVVVEYKVSQSFPVTEIKKAEELYDLLENKRRIVRLSDILDI